MSKIKSVAFCCDGNRRWAEKEGKNRLEGHRFGAEKIFEVIEWSKEKNIKDITFYLFSTENWNRSSIEIKTLLKLFEEILEKKIKDIEKKKNKYFFFG